MLDTSERACESCWRDIATVRMTVEELKAKYEQGIKLIDSEIEFLWKELRDIPVNEDDELDVDFFIWKKGASKIDDVWVWFDGRYSLGLSSLL